MESVTSKIGRYEIRSELGRGAMGVVFLAYDPEVCRDVAIKTIAFPPGFSAEEKHGYRERFLHEARTAGRLSHPAIVTVHDFDQNREQDEPFIVMEYVRGRSLKQFLIDEGAGNPSEVFALGDALADGLRAAHQAGVTHRDIKPANILIREPDGAAKIADFGIAQLPMSELTQAGTTIGSPAYIAPERLRGRRADHRSDLFSLAVILYESFCGKRPFRGEDVAEISGSILDEKPAPITQLVPQLPPSADLFFERALAKDPEDRFADATGFRQAWIHVQRDFLAGPQGADVGATRIMAPLARPTGVVDPLWWSERFRAVKRALPRPYAARVGWAVLILLAFLLGWIFAGGETPSDSGRSGLLDFDRPTPADVPRQPRPVAPQAGGAQKASPPTAGSADDARAGAERAPAIPEKAGGRATTAPAPARAGAKPTRAVKPPATPVAGPPKPAPARTAASAPAPAPAAPAVPAAQPPVAAPASGAEVAEAAPSRLIVEVRSSIKEGRLTVRLGDEPIYELDLETEQRRWTRFVKKATGRIRQQETEEIEIPPGPHTLTARIDFADKERQPEKTIQLDASAGGSQTLVIKAGRVGRPLTLQLE